MAIPLRADTATNVKMGVFVDVGDGFTPETGITLGAADEAELLKHGSTNVTDISGNGWGAITGSDGWYWLTLTAANLDTEGPLTIVVNDDSVCLPVFMEFIVLNAPAYDALYAAAGTDYLPVDVAQIESADPTDTIRDSIVDDATLIDATDLNALSASGNGSALSAVPWNAAWDAEVQSECTDALNAYDPPTKAEVDAAVTTAHSTTDAAIAALNNISVADIIAGVADGSYDLQEMLRLITAACLGKSSGGGTNTLVFRDTADTKDRITATVDADGNRTAMSLDAS